MREKGIRFQDFTLLRGWAKIPLYNASKKSEMLDVVYSSYNYKLNSNQFKQFFKNYNLKQELLHNSKNNVVYEDNIDATVIDKMNLLLGKELSGNSGSSRCAVNNGICGGGGTSEVNQVNTDTALQVKPSRNSNYINANILGSYKVLPKNGELVSINFQTAITNVLDKNYIIISQLSKNSNLFGQIILISFKMAE